METSIKETRLKQWDEMYLEEEINKLPPRIQKDIKSITFPNINQIESSYLWGTIGSGKTIKAVFMMLSYLRDEYVIRHKKEALFIPVPELLLEFKSSYSHNREDIPDETELIKKYSEIDLLVLDDFGVEKITDWSFQLLYIVINRRYENLKKTIFTSNFNLEQLAEKLGDDRIPSRIQQMCEIIQFNGKDYRVR